MHLEAADLATGREAIERLISDLIDQGDDEPRREVTPWVSAQADGGVGVHIGRERIAVLDRDRCREFRDAIGRWGQGTGTLSVHATLYGDVADTARMVVFVSLPAGD